MQPGRGYGYVLPQPYVYYMRENELPRLQKQIKTIEISDEKARTSPFDTVEVTPVKTVETASETRIASPQAAYIHTPLPEPSHYPPIGMGSILLQPSPSGVMPTNVISPPMQRFAYHMPIPEPTVSTRPFSG
ncbi:unnamed protein product [Toxocara canis]|uniref:ZM domain-containing protein n=1 Tax=Toxocara canis TaxID=6265 RepID=A0A183U8Z1_TOXCA|nr:unnamed protein product [Toxocara canis]